jgi:hypothetical protein
VLQQGDFEGIFKAMDGLPVVIRLIDPPLHEFLPNLEEQLVKVTRAEDRGGASEDDEDLLRTIKSMHEQNPMLGLRGVRLGLMIPDFVKVQTRAILNAQIKVKAAGGNPIAKIMIPLVGHVNELARTRELLEAEAKAVESKAGVSVDYKFGTMIEVPRGALTADEIAREASFFSFGTNDLTQMTFGYSRDDAEGQPVPDARRRGRGPDEDRGRQGSRHAAESRDRHLRRARWGSRVHRQGGADRPRLRVLLAVPRARGAAGGGTGHPRREVRARRERSLALWPARPSPARRPRLAPG